MTYKHDIAFNADAKMLRSFQISDYIRWANEEQVDTLRDALIENQIDDELYEQALEDEGIEVDPADVDNHGEVMMEQC